jgi:hypothetical protein
VEDLVDWAAFAQVEPSQGVYRGGWRYHANYSTSDNSTAQWPVLGLIAAEQWGIFAPAWVKSELEFWVTYIQHANGCSGYADPNTWHNCAKTGGLLSMFYYLGDDESAPRVQAAIDCLNSRWNNGPSGTWYGNKSHPYAMFGVFKGLMLLGIDTIPNALANTETPAGDWLGDYHENLVNTQNANGSWTGYSYWVGALAAGWNIVILQGTIFPVEIEVDVQEPACTSGYDVEVTYSVARFPADGTVTIHEDGSPVHTIILDDFQGETTYTQAASQLSEGPHTWLAEIDVIGGGIDVHAEDTDLAVVEDCGDIEVGGTVNPVDKTYLLTPWIVLGTLAFVTTIGTIIALKRRQSKS